MDSVDDLNDLCGPPCSKTFASQLLEMFPDACPHYINRLCANSGEQPENLHALINEIISDPNYPKRAEKGKTPIRAMDSNEQFEMLKELFPDADPDYLQYHVELYTNNEEDLQAFIENTFEQHDYPTITEQLRKQQLSAQVRQYTDEFKIEEFLKVIPDPEKYFNDPARMPAISSFCEDIAFNDIHYAMMVLKNMYSNIKGRTISETFAINNFNVVKTANDLDINLQTSTTLTQSKRKPYDTHSFPTQNIPLLQEIAYVQHRKDINLFLRNREEENLEKRNHARKNKLFQICGCCFDGEVMPQAVANCELGCVFCKECVQTYVEVLFSEGKLDYPCLSNCGSHFSLQMLQDVSNPKLFSKMVQKRHLREMKAAGIEGIESCPFCDFATVPAPGDKIFHCMDPECMKKSCRQCKEPSHIPLRCEEVEKDDETKTRTYIENKMSEAILRKCYNCGMPFIKLYGCNKMTCSCGAKMCYICGEAVNDFSHFNRGFEDDITNKCPLYSDTNKLDLNLVLKSAELAKAEIGVIDDPSKLKFDPTIDFEKHFKEQQMMSPEEWQEMNYNEVHHVHVVYPRHHHVLPYGVVLPQRYYDMIPARYVVGVKEIMRADKYLVLMPHLDHHAYPPANMMPQVNHQVFPPANMMPQLNHQVLPHGNLVEMRPRNHRAFPPGHMPRRTHQVLPLGNMQNRQLLPPRHEMPRRNHHVSPPVDVAPQRNPREMMQQRNHQVLPPRDMMQPIRQQGLHPETVMQQQTQRTVVPGGMIERYHEGQAPRADTVGMHLDMAAMCITTRKSDQV